MTSVPQRRLQEMILCSRMKGNSGKMTDFGESGTVHRTTCGHFLAKGKWDDKRLEETQKRESFQTVSELSHQHGTPLFVSIDDTVVPKTAPSSKAKRPTQGAGWHYSHLEGKVIYGHQGERPKFCVTAQSGADRVEIQARGRGENCPLYRHINDVSAVCQGAARSVWHTLGEADRQLGVDDAPILPPASPFSGNIHHSQV